MFDMIDVIQMTKISKHYLLEYQTLLDTYEMQAHNVTSGFRVLDFSEDISDVDCTSDDWSMNESYSETSGEMTNSAQTNVLPNPPEYSVCAGSKPLSIIIRRCNTPTVACSPIRENVKESSCGKGEALPSKHCDVTNQFIFPEEELVCCSESDKDAICNTSESIDIVHISSKENVLRGVKEKNPNCSKGITPFKSPSKEVTNTVNNCDTEKNNIGCAQKSDESFQVLNDQNSLSEVSLLPCLEEKSQNDSFSFFCAEENKVLDDVIQKVVDDLCPPSGREILDSSEYVSCSLVDVNSSNNIDSDKIIVPKHESYLSNELHHCINDISSSSNSVIFHPSHVDDVHLNFTGEAAEDLEVSYFTSPFCHDNSDLVTSEQNVIENCVTEQSTLRLDESLEIHPSELVDGWRQSNCSPLLFSSDDESSSITDEVNRGIEAALAPSPQYNVLLSGEKKRVGRLQELLMGAPPPPTVTMPLHSSSDMLDALKGTTLWTVSETATTSCTSSRMPWNQEAVTMPWPQVKCLQYPGIHYNHGSISEQFESLCQKLLTRCVGAETASSVTIWSSFTLPVSRRERRALTSRRSGSDAPTGLSPGRRLSHLARRHRTFSSATLLNDGSRLHCTLPHVAPERRTILVEDRRKESRKHQSSQKKNLVDKSRDVHAMKLNSSKRALFQSPTEEKKASVPSKFRPSSATAVRSRRALFGSDQTESQSRLPGTSNGDSTRASRKRTRADSEEEMCERLPRRRLFSDTDIHTLPVTMKGASRQMDLSSTHKKKLLWAVAEALKKRGVGFSHPQFRACAAVLASTCRGHVHEVLALRQGSTSDRLLQLALRFVDGAVAQHVKGHPPREQTECKEAS